MAAEVVGELHWAAMDDAGAAMDDPNTLFALDEQRLSLLADSARLEWSRSLPFRHVVLDHFLPQHGLSLLSSRFPDPSHPVWLDWRTRSPHQYGKQGPGDSVRFGLLDDVFHAALHEFNSWRFLKFLEEVTSIDALLPDPYFTGGGMHQILQGGILDIHTDFNYYEKLKIYRRLNVILYLTEDWAPSYGGALELWDNSPAAGGRCFLEVAPISNRLIIFETDKTSFHGHPREWRAPSDTPRRSIALYYYTAEPAAGRVYDGKTDFQGYVTKALPAI